jgi:hypothetical protein
VFGSFLQNPESLSRYDPRRPGVARSHHTGAAVLGVGLVLERSQQPALATGGSGAFDVWLP